MKRNQEMTWAQVSLAANAPMLTKATMVDGNTEIGIMPTGVGLGVIASAPSVLDIVNSIMAEASECLNALTDN
jgi:ribose 5-phosphate isomerase RpiB